MGDEKHRIATRFGNAAESYFDNEVHYLGVDRETFAPWCRDATHVLDVATGTGHTTGAITDVGIFPIVAADAAPEAITTAIREYPVADVIADTEHLPLADDVFDTTAYRIAVYRLPDPEAFAAEVARVLEPDGVFALKDNVAPEDAALTAFFNGVGVLRGPTHARLHPASWRHE